MAICCSNHRKLLQERMAHLVSEYEATSGGDGFEPDRDEEEVARQAEQGYLAGRMCK